MDDVNDSEMLRRFAEGDTRAFGDIYDKYYRRVFGYCYHVLRDRDATEDLVQSIFVKALESVKSLEKPESFYFWLFSIARNEVYAWLRVRRRDVGGVSDEEVWDTETPHEHLVKREISDMVQEGLQRLKPEYREVLVLRQFEKLSYADIASITGSTISSVESRLYKARKALMKCLEPVLRERTLT